MSTTSKSAKQPAEHTAGPWDYLPMSGDIIQVIDKHFNAGIGEQIATVDTTVTADVERDANGRLLAAAPDMLALLQDIAEHGYGFYAEKKIKSIVAMVKGLKS